MLRTFLATAFALASVFAFANDSDITIILEKNTSVDGTYASVPLKYTITKQMITEGAYSDLSDVLRSIPSLTFANDTLGNGTTGVIDLRGFGETAHSSTLVLLNGATLNNPTNEAPNLSLIPLAMIEKIEIFIGGASAAAGNEASGGVVSISTVPGSVANYTQVQANGGQFGSLGAGVSGAIELGDQSGLSYAAETLDQTGYRDFSEFTRDVANLNWSHSVENLSINLSLLSSDEDRNGSGAITRTRLDSNRTDVGTRSIADIEQQLVSGSFILQRDPTLNYTLNLSSRDSDQFVLYDYTFGSPFAAEEEVNQQTLVNSISLLRQSNKGPSAYDLGLTLQESEYTSKREYYGYSPTTKDQERREWAVFATYEDAVSADTRVMLSYRHADSEDKLSDSAAVGDSLNAISTSLTKQTEVADYFLRLDRGFRLPTFDENNSTYTDQYLLPLTHVSLEAGVTNPTLGLSGFFTRTKNEIRPTVRDYGSYFQTTNANIEETERFGLQAFKRLKLTSQTRLHTAYSFTEAQSVKGLDKDKYLPGVPQHVVSLALKHQHNSAFTSTLDWRYQSASYALNDHQNLYDRHGEYAVADYALNYKHEGFRGGIRINNLFDTRYNLYHIVSAIPSTAESSGPNVTPAEPINLQVHVEYVF